MNTVWRTCACPGHECRQSAREGRDYCTRCLAGWHTAVCPDWTEDKVNHRLLGLDLTVHSRCGRCGAQLGEHPRNVPQQRPVLA